MLVAARFEDGEPMSDAELRDQLMTLLLAGHETTATALAWTFDLLLRHPAALERLRSELDAGRRGLPAGGDLRGPAPAPGDPARRSPTARGAECEWLHAAAGHRRDPGDLADAHTRGPLPDAARVPARAVPRRGSRDLRAGSRSAAGFGAALAPRSPSSRCGSSCARRFAATSCAARAPAGGHRATQHHLLASAWNAGGCESAAVSGGAGGIAAGPHQGQRASERHPRFPPSSSSRRRPSMARCG